MFWPLKNTSILRITINTCCEYTRNFVVFFTSPSPHRHSQEVFRKSIYKAVEYTKRRAKIAKGWCNVHEQKQSLICQTLYNKSDMRWDQLLNFYLRYISFAKSIFCGTKCCNIIMLTHLFISHIPLNTQSSWMESKWTDAGITSSQAGIMITPPIWA